MDFENLPICIESNNPSLESDLISDMARSFYLEEKKVSNKNVKRKLEYALKFPSFIEGLEDIYENIIKV